MTPCRFFLIEREIPFPVRECSFYEDRRVASMEHMEEIAWRLRTLNPSRQVGFVSASQLHREQEEEESAEARLVRDEPSKHRD